jgi:hypothetical protein
MDAEDSKTCGQQFQDSMPNVIDIVVGLCIMYLSGRKSELIFIYGSSTRAIKLMKIGTTNTYNLETIDVLATVNLISNYRLGRKIKFLQARDDQLDK